MELMEAGIVSLDTHPDPKLATVPTATRSNASRTDHMPGAATGAELWRIAAELRHCRRSVKYDRENHVMRTLKNMWVQFTSVH